MAAGDVARTIETARRMLNDIGPVYKWLDKELAYFLNEAQASLIRARPDAVASQTVPLSTPTTQSTATGTLDVDKIFEDVLVQYICSEAHKKQAPYADLNKSVAHRAAFDASISR